MTTRTCEHCCIQLNNLRVRFGNNRALEDVHVHVNCGEVVAIVGPNGAGKTTLLRTILGEIPYRGEIKFRVSGQAADRPKIGYVPQKLQFDRDAPISVSDLVVSAISRRPVWAGVPEELTERVRTVLALFSAEHLLRRRIGELSGGELQRVLLAMAMTPEPNLLLLDEPGSGVDVKGLALFYQIVEGLKKKHDIAVIMATHDLAGISSYADRLILLDRTVIAEGSPAEVLADKELIRVFGPSLWNISCLPGMPPAPSAREGDNGTLV